MILDNTAEAGDGATGWALGNQACNGNIPAFAPKPINIHIIATNIIVVLPL
jgi:hypothetical protein